MTETEPERERRPVTVDAKCYWIIAVSPEGYADPESGPVGPFNLSEAVERAHREPDPLSGWRELILVEYDQR